MGIQQYSTGLSTEDKAQLQRIETNVINLPNDMQDLKDDLGAEMQGLKEDLEVTERVRHSDNVRISNDAIVTSKSSSDYNVGKKFRLNVSGSVKVSVEVKDEGSTQYATDVRIVVGGQVKQESRISQNSNYTWRDFIITDIQQNDLIEVQVKRYYSSDVRLRGTRISFDRDYPADLSNYISYEGTI